MNDPFIKKAILAHQSALMELDPELESKKLAGLLTPAQVKDLIRSISRIPYIYMGSMDWVTLHMLYGDFQGLGRHFAESEFCRRSEIDESVDMAERVFEEEASLRDFLSHGRIILDWDPAREAELEAKHTHLAHVIDQPGYRRMYNLNLAAQSLFSDLSSKHNTVDVLSKPLLEFGARVYSKSSGVATRKNIQTIVSTFSILASNILDAQSQSHSQNGATQHG